VPIVAVGDGEAGLLDNIGSIVGVKQRTLAVRKFSKCGRPDQVFGYHHLDPDSIVDACGRALSETALEDLLVAPSALTQHSQRPKAGPGDWRELWPESRPSE
jgi:pyruvate dehydrogenase E1 component